MKCTFVSCKDWWILAVGLVGAVLVGTSFPLFGIVFGEGLAVIFDSVDGTIFDEMHPAAGGMLAIGVALGTANFFKVLYIHSYSLTFKLYSWVIRIIVLYVVEFRI